MYKYWFVVLLLNFSVAFSQNLSYSVCDGDSDGVYEFSKEELSSYVESQMSTLLGGVSGNAEVYISANNYGTIKVTNIGSNPQIEDVCLTDYKFPHHELAFNSNQELFLAASTGNFIYKMDESTCGLTPVANNFPYLISSMSFDTKDNLYVSSRYSGPNVSKVFRADASDLGNFYVWHDFGSGSASGDFVVLNGKMYIPWVVDLTNSRVNHLFEVTLGSNNEYISHVDLGRIEDATWGLASEYGKLYGVARDKLYEISLPDLTATTIITNPNVGLTNDNFSWFGAAGKHEALDVGFSFYESQVDANLGNANVINFPWENSTPFSQTIYVRVEERSSGTLVGVFPFILNVNVPPTISLNEEYVVCNNGSLTPVTIDTNLSGDDYSFVWYKDGILLDDETSSSLETSTPGNYRVVVNGANLACSAEASTVVVQSDIFIDRVQFLPTQIIISASGTDEPFTYSVNNVWQSSPIFTSFPLGKLYGYAKNDKGCLSNQFVKFLAPGNTITPNGDGFNDYFSFEFPSENTEAKIVISDRYGKILYDGVADSNFRWYGDYKGRPVSSGTYWYVVSVNGTEKYSGFILVKHRN